MKKKKTFQGLQVVFWLLSIFFLSCTNKLRFNETESFFEYTDCNDTCEKRIEYAKKFVDILIKSYQNKCKDGGLKSKFYDSVSLMNTNSISANYYLSKSREFMISVFKSSENKFTTFGTEFPVQFYLLQQNNFRDARHQRELLQNERNIFLETYDSIKCIIKAISPVYISNITLIGKLEFKFFEFQQQLNGPPPILYLNNVRLVSIKQNEKFDTLMISERGIVISERGIAVLSPKEEIENYMYAAEIAGEDLAETEIKNLFINSEYFREVMAIQRLSPIANEILIKKERASKDQNFSYDFVEFKHDIELLNKIRDSFNIVIKTEDILYDAKSKLRTGTLLWFYDSYISFSFQWLLINVFYISILAFYTKYATKLSFPWDKKALLVFALTFNSWIFVKRPEGIEFVYWYPYLSLIPDFYLLFIYAGKKIRK